jgi:hypothetical protein
MVRDKSTNRNDNPDRNNRGRNKDSNVVRFLQGQTRRNRPLRRSYRYLCTPI